jgi:hypothetical protein
VAVVATILPVMVAALGIEPAAMSKRRRRGSAQPKQCKCAERENIRLFHIVPPGTELDSDAGIIKESRLEPRVQIVRYNTLNA